MPRLAGFCCNNDVCNNCCKISKKKNRKTKTNLLKEWSMCFGGKKCFGIDCSCWLHYFGLVSVTKWGWLQLHVPIVYKLCELEQNNRPQVLEWHAGYPRRLVEIAFSNQIYAHLTHLQIKQKTSLRASRDIIQGAQLHPDSFKTAYSRYLGHSFLKLILINKGVIAHS